MLESLIALAGALTDGLSKLKIRKSEKKRTGQALARFYLALSEITENGGIILQALRAAKNGKKIVDVCKLINLLLVQADRVKRIRFTVKRSKLSTIFKIHLPELSDLEVLLEAKGRGIAVFVEQLETQKLRRFGPVNLDHHILERYGIGWFKLVPPSEKILRQARRNLTELKRLANLLRQFLVEQFQVDEII